MVSLFFSTLFVPSVVFFGFCWDLSFLLGACGSGMSKGKSKQNSSGYSAIKFSFISLSNRSSSSSSPSSISMPWSSGTRPFTMNLFCRLSGLAKGWEAALLRQPGLTVRRVDLVTQNLDEKLPHPCLLTGRAMHFKR